MVPFGEGSIESSRWLGSFGMLLERFYNNIDVDNRPEMWSHISFYQLFFRLFGWKLFTVPTRYPIGDHSSKYGLRFRMIGTQRVYCIAIDSVNGRVLKVGERDIDID